jgi:hypothetical protein
MVMTMSKETMHNSKASRELTTAELELVAGGLTDEQRIAVAYFGAQYLGGPPPRACQSDR